MTLTITHTHADGTLLDGTSRGDGSNVVLKEVRGWRWSRNLGSWYVPRSRDVRANTPLINRTKEALEAAGFDVDVSIDDEFRSTAVVEDALAERQEQRVDALYAKADRKAADAVAADEAHERAHKALPPFGEPIKVGHHSERRHRKSLDRAWNALGKSVEANRDADEAARRAESAATTTQTRYNPGVIQRRLKKLTADLGRAQRAHDGETRTLYVINGVRHVEKIDAATGAYRDRLAQQIEHLNEQIEHWTQVLADAAASGANIWSKDTIRIGDRIAYWGGWEVVSKVNAKSIRVEGFHYGTLPYDKIKSVRDADGKTVTIVNGERVVEEKEQ